jgi:hypothetical protein
MKVSGRYMALEKLWEGDEGKNSGTKDRRKKESVRMGG